MGLLLRKIAVLAAISLCGSNVNGLEATSASPAVSVAYTFEARLEALSAALTTAFNSLKSRVDAFDGRIGALEAWKATMASWRVTVDADIANLKSRMAAAETNIKWLVSTWRPAIEKRISTLESKPAGLTNIVVDSTACTTVLSNERNWAYCPANTVMTGLQERGLATGSKVWHAGFRCCPLKLK